MPRTPDLFEIKITRFSDKKKTSVFIAEEQAKQLIQGVFDYDATDAKTGVILNFATIFKHSFFDESNKQFSNGYAIDLDKGTPEEAQELIRLLDQFKPHQLNRI